MTVAVGIMGSFGMSDGFVAHVAVVVCLVAGAFLACDARVLCLSCVMGVLHTMYAVTIAM